MNQTLYMSRRIVPATRTDFLVAAVADFPLAGASIDLWFSEGNYYDGGIVADPTGDLSISRASTGYAQTVAGTLTNFATDTLRITDLGLLVEDARTNLIIQSQDLSTTWAQQGITLSADATSAPDGTTTADQITATNANPGQGCARGAGINFAADTYYTLSCYLKLVDSNEWPLIQASDFSANGWGGYFHLSGAGTVGTLSGFGDGSVLSGSIEALANGWYRCSVTGKCTALRGLDPAVFCPRASDGGSGVVGAAVEVWGVQIELAGFASSYIPTTSAAATRAADAVTCVGNLYSTLEDTDYSVVLESQSYSPVGVAGATLLADPGNAFLWQASAPRVGTGIGWTHSFYTAAFSSKTWLDIIKVGLAQDGSGRSLVATGETVVSDSNPYPGGGAPLTLGTSFGDYYSFTYYRRLTAWNSRLADAALQGFTAP